MTDEKQIEIKRGTGGIVDLLNEEIAELSKAQIEEIGQAMANCDTTCNKCFEQLQSVMAMKIKEREKHCQAYYYAKRLYNLGYRKLPENAVVVMPDKLNEYQKAELQIIKDQARKETAREILSKVGKVCGDYQWFKNLRKEYGVEVEDND